MNRDDVIRMAREAKCTHVNLDGDRSCATDRLERFANLVADAVRVSCAKSSEIAASRNARLIKQEAIEAEREACEKICRAMVEFPGASDDHKYMADYCAVLIRARATSLTS